MNFFQKVYYKLKIDILVGYAGSFFDAITWKPFHLLTTEDTIEYILENAPSVSRFGDGELHILAYGCALGFQKRDAALRERLHEVATTPVENLLVCLPNRVNILSPRERRKLPEFWQKALKLHLHEWTKRFGYTEIPTSPDWLTVMLPINRIR